MTVIRGMAAFLKAWRKTTIRSRCTLVSLPPPALSDRLRHWRDGGFAVGAILAAAEAGVDVETVIMDVNDAEQDRAAALEREVVDGEADLQAAAEGDWPGHRMAAHHGLDTDRAHAFVDRQLGSIRIEAPLAVTLSSASGRFAATLRRPGRPDRRLAR